MADEVGGILPISDADRRMYATENSAMDVKLTTADTECAHALLDLARSFSSQNASQYSESHLKRNPIDSSRSVLNPLSANRSPSKRLTLRGYGGKKAGGTGRGSPPKRGRGSRGGRTHNSLVRRFDASIAGRLGCRTPEEMREEVLRRMRLDHPYAAHPGSYPQTGPVDPAFYNLLEEVEQGSEVANSLLQQHHSLMSNRPYPYKISYGAQERTRFGNSSMADYANNVETNRPAMKFYTERGNHHDEGAPRRSLDSLAQLLNTEYKTHLNNNTASNTAYGVGKGGNNIHTNVEQQQQQKKQQSPTANNNTNADLYQPYDDKYKNFNLLFKCLTNDSPEDNKGGTRKRCHSTNSATSDGTGNRQTPQGNRPKPTDVRCEYCLKVFSNGIFLRKHKNRAHPNADSFRHVLKSDTVVCEVCSFNVEKDKIEEHTAMCTSTKHQSSEDQRLNVPKDESSLNAGTAATLGDLSAEKRDKGCNVANCQFCGVRMRRQLLVRHLAKKHCIENKSGVDNDGNLSESGSSTLSGLSDVENKCLSGNENIIQCDICFAFVPKPMLSQHVAEKHFNMVSGTGYTPAGFYNETNGDVDMKEENGSDIIIKSEEINHHATATARMGSPTTDNFPQQQQQHNNNSSSVLMTPSSTDESVNSSIGNKRVSVSPPSAGICKQYMLHRFLSDDSAVITPEITAEQQPQRDGSVDNRGSDYGQNQHESGIVVNVGKKIIVGGSGGNNNNNAESLKQKENSFSSSSSVSLSSSSSLSPSPPVNVLSSNNPRNMVQTGDSSVNKACLVATMDTLPVKVGVVNKSSSSKIAWLPGSSSVVLSTSVSSQPQVSKSELSSSTFPTATLLPSNNKSSSGNSGNYAMFVRNESTSITSLHDTVRNLAERIGGSPRISPHLKV